MKSKEAEFKATELTLPLQVNLTGMFAKSILNTKSHLSNWLFLKLTTYSGNCPTKPACLH